MVNLEIDLEQKWGSGWKGALTTQLQSCFPSQARFNALLPSPTPNL